MSAARHPVVGVLGGMGPLATVELMRRVVEATPAQDDCDHIHLIVDSNPHVPSRIAALVEGGGASPEAALARMACKLRESGCDLLAMPCNTAHLYVQAIRAASGLEVLDMVALTMAHLRRRRPVPRYVGILGSKAVQQTGLFARACQEAGMTAVFPEARQADALMQVIKGVKRNESRLRLRRRFAALVGSFKPECGRQPDVLLVACSELSVLYNAGEGIEDSLAVLAAEIVRRGRMKTTSANQGDACSRDI